MVAVLSLIIGFWIGFIVCWVWQTNAQKRLQQDTDALKASAIRSFSQKN